jgi:hypothetical protein
MHRQKFVTATRRCRLPIIAALAVCAGLSPLHAQDGAASATAAVDAATPTAPDPARLEAARRLVALSFPDGEASELIADLAGEAFDNQIKAMLDSDEMKDVAREAPQLRRRLDRFAAEAREMMTQELGAAAPRLLEVTAEIYALRFTVAEMAEIEQFLMTPTGRSYARLSFEMINDPRFLAWQTDVSERLQRRMQPMLERFMADVVNLAPKTTN